MGEDASLKLVIDVRVDATSRLTIAARLLNTSEHDVFREITSKSQPLLVSVLDKDGRDIYWAASEKLQKDGKGVTRPEGGGTLPLNLKAGQSVSYVIEHVGLPQGDSADGPLPIGPYKVQVRLATAERNDGKIRTILITSNVASAEIR